MAHRRPTGSERSIREAAPTQSSGAFTAPGKAPLYLANATQTRLGRESNRSVRHERDPQEAATGLLETGVAGGQAHTARPRFARLHASIAERPMEWAWQPLDGVESPGEREPIGAARLSARLLWLGGAVSALLAAGVISAVVTVQSARSLPFESWARRDLTQGAGEVRLLADTDGMLPGQPAGALMAGHEPKPARAKPAKAIVSAAAGHERGASDAAVARPGSAPDIEIALLGPILASAGEANHVAAKLRVRTAAAPAAAVEPRIAPAP
jgi:hypothetical protein